ncbi:MAG: ABC transporter permease [Lachnospiraceae bacterium]|nr:ABC transporter permease [Lachnospiraceae bacterium]
MKYGRYFLAQLKRIKKLLPEMLCLSVLFFGVTFFVGKTLITGSDYEAGKIKYRIGIMGKEEESFIDMGIFLLESFDDSKYMMELVKYTDFEEAKSDLYDGTLSALCEIPAGFYDSINYLSNDLSIKYYTAAGSRGVTGVFMDEITGIISDYIVYSEAGILSLYDYLGYKGASAEMQNEAVDKLFMSYMSALLGRGNLVTVKTLGISNGLSTYGYYFTGLTLFLMSVLSFAGISFFIKKNMTLDKLAHSKGIAVPGQIAADFVAYFLCNVVCVTILMVPIFRMLKAKVIEIPEFFTTENVFLFKFYGNVLVAMVLICMFELLIFEVLEGTVNKVIFSFTIILSCAYISGYLYPASFFPESISKVGRLLPTGVAMTFLSSFLTMKGRESATLWLVGYVVAIFVVLCLVRTKKINK